MECALKEDKCHWNAAAPPPFGCSLEFRDMASDIFVFRQPGSKCLRRTSGRGKRRAINAFHDVIKCHRRLPRLHFLGNNGTLLFQCARTGMFQYIRMVQPNRKWKKSMGKKEYDFFFRALVFRENWVWKFINAQFVNNIVVWTGTNESTRGYSECKARWKKCRMTRCT